MPVAALVTGASSGIGEATARRLAREPGAQLILVARREQRLRAERYVPRPWALLAVARVLAPGLLRRLQGTRAGAVMARQTDGD